jgi:hypothetical protein
MEIYGKCVNEALQEIELEELTTDDAMNNLT